MDTDRIKKIEDLKKKVENTDPRMADSYIGLLQVETSLLLSEVVELLQKQIPITISELRTTIGNAADKTIEADKKLAESNNRHSRAMFYLTIILAVAGIIQALSAYAQWKVSEKQTAYFEVQSRSDRIGQARLIQESRERCKQSPELKESGLYYTNGKSASCADISKQYKEVDSMLEKIKALFRP